MKQKETCAEAEMYVHSPKTGDILPRCAWELEIEPRENSVDGEIQLCPRKTIHAFVSDYTLHE